MPTMFRPPLKQYLYGTVIIIVILLGAPFAIIWFSIQMVTRTFIQWSIQNEGGVLMETVDELMCPLNENDTFYNEIYIKIKGIVTKDIAMKVIQERLLRDDRLFKLRYYERSMGLHRAWFPDPRFDINNHVLLHPDVIAESVIMLLFSNYVSQRMPDGQPGWQFIIFNLDNGNTVVLTRINHTIADGMSLLRMLLEHLIDDPFKLGSNLTPKRVTNRSKLQTIISALTDQPIVYSSFLQPIPYGEPFHTLNLTKKKRLAISDPVPMDLIQNIKNQNLTSVNDVVVTCMATALANHVCGRSDSAVDESSHQQLTRKIQLATIIPAFVPGVIEGPIKLGNHVGAMIFDLPITPQIDIYDRLQKVKMIFDYLKQSLRPFSAYFSQLVLKHCLPSFVTGLAIGMVTRRNTAMISNMPGPNQKIQIAGFPIEELAYFVPGPGTIGLGMSVISYNGSMRMAIQADESVLDNPEKICEGFVQAVGELASEYSIEATQENV